MTFDQLINGISDIDKNVERQAIKKWDSLAKPLGSLGELENIITKICTLSDDLNCDISKRTLLVFCADNGVVNEGVTQCDHTVTTAVAKALGEGTSTVNFMAKCNNCDVLPINIGMIDDTPSGVLNKCIKRRTDNIFMQSAMTEEECIKAIMTGADLVGELKKKGTKIILTGEMGIGNTTTTACVSSVLLNVDSDLLVGRGAGLSDKSLERKKYVVRESVKRVQNIRGVINIIRELGGLDIAALCGVCLGGVYFRVPIVLDGVITCAAALCAVRLNPLVRNALIASHSSEEPAAKLLLKALDLKPIITANMRLGEGSGAVMALPLIDTALSVYNSSHTFGELKIEEYRHY